MFKIIDMPVCDQIAARGRATLNYEVEGCYTGFNNAPRIEITPEYDDYMNTSVPDRFKIEAKVNVCLNPEVDQMVALANLSAALADVANVIDYWTKNMGSLMVAWNEFRKTVEANNQEAKRKFNEDTTMYYSADDALDRLADRARNTWLPVDMDIRYRGEEASFSIVAKRTRDGKVRFNRCGYAISRKEAWKLIAERGAEVLRGI